MEAPTLRWVAGNTKDHKECTIIIIITMIVAVTTTHIMVMTQGTVEMTTETVAMTSAAATHRLPR